MVGRIFNLAKVDTVPCMFTALAYIESITDATNDIEQTENNKLC